MTVETASYISQLDGTLPLAGDKKSEGDNHLRLVKTVLQTQFPNFGTAAMNATTTELNYVVGVTSSIQTQINAKATKAGDTYTGAHDFTGGTIAVPTATVGDATTKAASTAFVSATAFNAALPGQTGNAKKFVTTDGANAAWAHIYGAPTVISTDTTAVAGGFYVLTASLTLTLPATPTAGDVVHVSNRSGVATCVIDRNGVNVMGLAENMTLDASDQPFSLAYADASRGWVLI
ncbi:MAG: hypothetical protein KBF63_13290 [Rhodoferax sp.]|nr:hypothetical protein [Rhodoferax sp.]